MLVRCVIGAESLPAFVDGLMNLVVGMTVLETREDSPETQQTVSYRGIPYKLAALGVIVDIVTDESWLDDLIRRIHEGARQDEFNVRHIHVFPVEASYHIRNGFMDV